MLKNAYGSIIKWLHALQNNNNQKLCIQWIILLKIMLIMDFKMCVLFLIEYSKNAWNLSEIDVIQNK